jgi:hypothetical protein
LLRQASRIRPLSDNPECILRISLGKARGDLSLSDGAKVHAGDPLVEIHLWNERLSLLEGSTAPLAWGVALLRDFRSSLRLLATRLHDDPDSREVVAVRGGFSFATDIEQPRRMFKTLGFDLVLVDRPRLRIWRPAFWDSLFASWLMWAFNPAGLHGKRLKDLTRLEIWMSRDCLLRRYSAPGSRMEERHPRHSSHMGRIANEDSGDATSNGMP